MQQARPVGLIATAGSNKPDGAVICRGANATQQMTAQRLAAKRDAGNDDEAATEATGADVGAVTRPSRPFVRHRSPSRLSAVKQTSAQETNVNLYYDIISNNVIFIIIAC